MKKTYLFFVAITLFSALSYAQTSNVELPKAIQTFLGDYFSGIDVLTCELEHNGNEVKEYDIVLKNGDELSFNRDGAWIEIEMALDKEIPEGVVPGAIDLFVKNKHKGVKICEIEKEHSGYEVKLSNDLELNFTQSGEYLGMNM